MLLVGLGVYGGGFGPWTVAEHSGGNIVYWLLHPVFCPSAARGALVIGWIGYCTAGYGTAPHSVDNGARIELYASLEYPLPV